MDEEEIENTAVAQIISAKSSIRLNMTPQPSKAVRLANPGAEDDKDLPSGGDPEEHNKVESLCVSDCSST